MPGVTLTGLEFLDKPPATIPAVCVVFGDEAFLKRESLEHLREAVLGTEDADFSFSEFDGEDAEVHEVFDCLSTVALFGGGRRLVVVRKADDFVSRNRPALEDYVAHPKASGVLVLEAGTWPANTKLAKAIAAEGLSIECKTPAPQAIAKWLVSRATKKHQARLDRQAADLLLDSVEPDLGLLDQELAKLALAAGENGAIDAALVREMVGGWRSKTTWDMLDLAAGGHAAEAILQLDRLLSSGESPVAILAQIGSTLRRFAAAARTVEQAECAGRRTTLKHALEAAGFRSFVVAKAENQLRQLGRQRSAGLYRAMLEADLALKGSSSAPTRARIVLEQLIARMSRAADTAEAR
ncbi:MAG TPA: DNA polymerase III subunit delta [Pirellulales bacterium]|nr:DNA polymerase III subunit delta [Pirellulales bacterium]